MTINDIVADYTARQNGPVDPIVVVRICSVDDCGGKPVARGYCNKHYISFRKTGSPTGGNEYVYGSLADKIAAKSNSGTADECWEWTAAVNWAGYGLLSVGGKSTLAHRVAYEAAHGPIPSGLILRHSCDNPPCVNPAHLSLGTHYENRWDRIDRGRDVPLLSSAQVAAVVSEVHGPNPRSLAAIARSLSVSAGTIRNIKIGNFATRKTTEKVAA